MRNAFRAAWLLLTGVLVSAQAAELPREYNVWYRQNGVMYDMTQDEAGSPVFISIGYDKLSGYNLMITRTAQPGCAAASLQHVLIIKAQRYAVQAVCQTVDGVTLHSIRGDAQVAQPMMAALDKGFTVVLDEDVKIWAANFSQPRFGSTPRL